MSDKRLCELLRIALPNCREQKEFEQLIIGKCFVAAIQQSATKARAVTQCGLFDRSRLLVRSWFWQVISSNQRFR